MEQQDERPLGGSKMRGEPMADQRRAGPHPLPPKVLASRRPM
ncbi:MAG: hypothetical protein ACI81O_000177 [Cyclobacteriaceae bacterium]|jgi:hypothetical protein